MPLTRAVILAAGRGTRMQRGAAAAPLTPAQRAAATQGLKPLIPFHGAPFLSYVLTSLADAGLRDVCAVVGPGAHPVREYYARAPLQRLRLDFAVQSEPRGSAHALLAAERCIRADDFLLINADNDYPVTAFTALRGLDSPGLIAFRAGALLAGNVTAERLGGYAVLDVADGYLRAIREKPPLHETADPHALISMTCWRFDTRIFDACRAVQPSARGEYELPDAVNYAINGLQMKFEAIAMDAAVLDLSRAEDAAAVADRLRGRRVAL